MIRTALGLAALATPAIAQAHTPIAGINNFYNGILHPLFVPAHLLVLVALGLYFGQRDLDASRTAVLAFVGAAVAGLFFAVVGSGIDLQTVQLAAAAIFGAMVAAFAPLPAAGRGPIAAVCGFIVAADSDPETLSGSGRLLSLLGTGVGMTLLLLYSMGLADFMKRKSWLRVGVRVAGSWIAASAVLVVALSVAGHAA